jgi:hypothetical protein
LLPVEAPRTEPVKEIVTAEEVEQMKAKEEHYRREQRIMFRNVIHELRKDRRYSYFCSPGTPRLPPSPMHTQQDKALTWAGSSRGSGPGGSA